MSTKHLPLVFIHIPKTAGTSIVRALKGTFGHKKIFHAGTSEQTAYFRHMTREQIIKYVVLSGHIPKQTFARKVPGSKCFSVIRDPYQRAASIYKHFSSVLTHQYYETNSQMSFSQHLEWLKANPDISHLMSQSYYLEGGGVDIYTLDNIDRIIPKMVEYSSLSVIPRNVPVLNAINKHVLMTDHDYELIKELYRDDVKLYEQLDGKN